MDTAQFNPAMLAALAQFLQAQTAPAAPVFPAAAPVKPATKKIEVICKKNEKDGVTTDDISAAQYPSSAEFGKAQSIMDAFATAALSGKPLPEGYIRINKNGAVSVLVRADYTTKTKIRLIVKTPPDIRLKAWRAYSEAAKKVTGITIGGLDMAIKTYIAEPGAAPLTFKAKVENLMKEPISDAEKIKRISEMLEDGRKTAEAPAPEVIEEAPAPKKRTAKKKAAAE
jgi:hypothetical protein